MSSPIDQMAGYPIDSFSMGTQNVDCVYKTERYAPDDNGSGVFKAIAETPLETKEQIPANYTYKKKKSGLSPLG